MLILVVGFSLLATLLALLTLRERRWWLVAALSIISIFFGLAEWHSLGSYAGWPTRAPVPPCLFDWGLIQEPDAQTNDPGAIYVWCTPTSVSNFSPSFDRIVKVGEPRAYALPYSRPLHKQVASAIRQTIHGQPVYVKKSGHGKGKPGQGKHGNGKPGGGSQNGGRLHFYTLPPPQLPAKIR